MYFSLLIEGAPFVGHDANDHNLLLKGAPFYNAISSTIHFSAIPTLFIEGITSELLVNRGAARRDEESVRPCTIGFGCVRHASRDCEADREWPADHRQSALRFSKPLARREFGSFSRAICHSRRNSWACLSSVWRWLGNA